MPNRNRHNTGKIKSRLTRSAICASVSVFLAKALDCAARKLTGRLRFKSEIWPVSFLAAQSM